MYQLIICEKPNAAKKIADALADNKAIKKSTRDGNSECASNGYFTIDGDQKELERALRSGGNGEGSYEMCELIGVELIDDKLPE